MSKPQRLCVYCGGKPVTHEHLYADRLKKHIPRPLAKHTMRSTVVYPEKTNVDLTTKTGDTHARRVRCVCQPCNGGWMRAIVDGVEDDLVAMIEGRPIIMGRKRQKSLAAWAAMTVMTSEFINTEMVAISQSDRDYMRKIGLPPRHWRIWISSYTPHPKLSVWSHHVMALEHEDADAAFYDPAPPNTQTSTLCVGKHLFVYVMSSEVAQDIIKRWRFLDSIKPLMLQIWPAAAPVVRWPPARALTGGEAIYVAEDLFQRVDQKMRRDLAQR
jgi:hypothetical protein